jgi:hypothetical protein
MTVCNVSGSVALVVVCNVSGSVVHRCWVPALIPVFSLHYVVCSISSSRQLLGIRCLDEYTSHDGS